MCLYLFMKSLGEEWWNQEGCLSGTAGLRISQQQQQESLLFCAFLLLTVSPVWGTCQSLYLISLQRENTNWLTRVLYSLHWWFQEEAGQRGERVSPLLQWPSACCIPEKQWAVEGEELYPVQLSIFSTWIKCSKNDWWTDEQWFHSIKLDIFPFFMLWAQKCMVWLKEAFLGVRVVVLTWWKWPSW